MEDVHLTKWFPQLLKILKICIIIPWRYIPCRFIIMKKLELFSKFGVALKDLLLSNQHQGEHALFFQNEVYMLRWEGVRGHFCMFGTYESTFYCWTAAFYGKKISRSLKKLLTFEGQRLDSFSIEIYRGNLVKIWSFWSIFFCIWTLDAGKLV